MLTRTPLRARAGRPALLPDAPRARQAHRRLRGRSPSPSPPSTRTWRPSATAPRPRCSSPRRRGQLPHSPPCPVLHGTSDPTRDTLTAAGLVTNPQVAQAVVKALRLHISAGDLLSKVTATPIGQSNLLALQATSDSAAEPSSSPTPSPIRSSPPAPPTCTQRWPPRFPAFRRRSRPRVPPSVLANSTLTAELAQLRAAHDQRRPDDHRRRPGPACRSRPTPPSPSWRSSPG